MKVALAGVDRFPIVDLVPYLKDHHELLLTHLTDSKALQGLNGSSTPMFVETVEAFKPDFVVFGQPEHSHDVLMPPESIDINSSYLDLCRIVLLIQKLSTFESKPTAVFLNVFPMPTDLYDDITFITDHPFAAISNNIVNLIKIYCRKHLIVNLYEPYGERPHKYGVIGSLLDRASKQLSLPKAVDNLIVNPTHFDDIGRLLAKVFARNDILGCLDIQCAAAVELATATRLIAAKFGVSISEDTFNFIPNQSYGSSARLLREVRDVPKISFERGLDIITA